MYSLKNTVNNMSKYYKNLIIKFSFVLILMIIQIYFNGTCINTNAEELNLSAQDYKNSTLPSLKEYKKSADKVWQVKDSSRIFILENKNLKSKEDLVKKDAIKFAKELNIITNKKFNFKNVVIGDKNLIKEGDIVLELLNRESPTNISEKRMNEEGYSIEVNENIIIRTNTDKGLFYGEETVLQLLKSKGNLLYGFIKDFPDVSERSLHIDMARKYYSKNWIIQRIKDMSWMKLNTIQLHFSENEGFRLESKKHPEIMSKKYITQEEMKAIIKVAKDNKIKVIPSLDVPGHLMKALENHKEFQLPKRYGGVDEKALDITNMEARKFVKDLYKEFAEIFKDSTDFHIGGDEFINFDKAYDYPILTQYAQKKYGPEGTWYDTYIEFTNEIASYVKSLGFTPRVWNDAHYRIGVKHQPKLQLDKDVIITYWTSWHKDMAPLKTFIDKNHKVVNYNDSKFYYVLGEAAGYTYPTPGKIFNSNWNPGQFPWRNKAADKINYKQDISYSYPESLLGASYAIWSDRPNAQTEKQVADGIYLALREMAERTYNSQNRENHSFNEFQNTVNKLGYSPNYNNELSLLPNVTVLKLTNEKPVINGVTNTTIKEGTKFNNMDGITVSDKEDGNITKNIKVIGNVDTNKPGVYELIYEVTDNNGNITRISRKITVEAVKEEKPIKEKEKDLTVKDKDESDSTSHSKTSNKDKAVITQLKNNADGKVTLPSTGINSPLPIMGAISLVAGVLFAFKKKK